MLRYAGLISLAHLYINDMDDQNISPWKRYINETASQWNGGHVKTYAPGEARTHNLRIA